MITKFTVLSKSPFNLLIICSLGIKSWKVLIGALIKFFINELWILTLHFKIALTETNSIKKLMILPEKVMIDKILNYS